jgi:hypothetical protein
MIRRSVRPLAILPLSPEEGKIHAADTHGRVKVIALQG